jgi:aminoglycoside phosphotransferase (APT) family kinase protein
VTDGAAEPRSESCLNRRACDRGRDHEGAGTPKPAGSMTRSQHRELFEALARSIEPRSKLLRTWELKGGVSAQVTAFEIEPSDGGTERLIVRRHGAVDLKRNPHIAADEFELLWLLKSAGVAAPAPRYLDAGGEIFSVPCLVIEYVEAEPEHAPADQREFVGQLATALAQIHEVDCSTTDVSFLPERLGIPDVPVPRPGQPAEGLRIRDVLESALPLPQRNRSVLLHGDFWPGNTLWKDGRLVAVIDWEDAAIGDPLADVANARLDLVWALGMEAMADFTRRYGSSVTGVDFTDLPYWDLWADLRLAGRVAEWGLDDVTEQAMRAGHEAFVAQALEALSAR